MLYALWTHYLKRYLSIPISKLTMLCHALLVIFPVPWGQILARDERQEQGQLEEEYAWAKRAGGMSIHSFYVPQQLSSTSWWHVSTVTVYGIECTQHLVDYSVSESMSSTNGSPSGLTIVFLSPAGGKFSDRRLKIRSQLTSGALLRYGGWRSNLWQQIIHRRNPQKTKWICKENSWPLPLQNSTVCCRVRDNLWISSFRYSSRSLWLWKSLKVAIVFWGKTRAEK